ncbi:MAG TPA: hypothetical protein VHE35_36590 [Kofleriaceae bacterium]|nr:hypothetical protein [Kofleriaceae bacterium]
MSDEDDRGYLLYDAERAEETPFEAEQRRGRERMLGIWRTAVNCIMEAQARETAARGADEQAGGEPEADDAAADDDDALAAPVANWVFPARTAGAGN